MRGRGRTQNGRKEVLHVTLHLFSHLRFIAGQKELGLDLPEGATLGQALEALVARYPEARPVVYTGSGLGVRLALNGRGAHPDQALSDGDEVAIFPPVGGGL